MIAPREFSREELLSEADLEKVVYWAELAANQVNDLLNEAADPDHPHAMNVATALVARVITARAIRRVATEWFAWLPSGPTLPVAAKLLTDIFDNPPPELEEGLIDMRTGAEI